MNTLKTKKSASFVIFLAWLAYTASYLGRMNYAANITQIIDFYQISKSEAGIVPTFFFFSYGIGQVVNGILSKRYNIKWIIFASLSVSTLINFTVAVTTNFTIVKWLWLLNGFTLSILWPTLVRLLSEAVPQKDLGKATFLMGTTVALGTLAIYGLSSAFAAFNNFKLAFYTAAAVEAAVAIIWLISYKKALHNALSQKNAEAAAIPEAAPAEETISQTKVEKKLFYATIYILYFFAIGVNLTKDGLTVWVPSILKEEYGFTDSISILLTLFLPIVAVFGNALSLRMHKKIPGYVTHCSVVFLLIAGFVGITILGLSVKQAALLLTGLIVVSLLAASLNNLITAIFPIFMRGRVNSGFYAGILNGFAYLGSTISAYGFGFIAENFGWTAIFYCLLGFCVISILIGLIFIIFQKKLHKEGCSV